MTASEPAHFSDRLHEAIARTGTPACVGLDPVIEKLPGAIAGKRNVGEDERIAEFCRGVLEAVAGIVPAVKFQSACFERYSAGGVGALDELIGEAKARGLIVILDAKRGDIGVSAEHYAHGAFAHGADAVTVSGYLGPDTIEPFLKSPGGGGRGVFVLVRTSNPGSDAVQSQRLADGRTVAEMMADHVAALGSGMGRRGDCGLSDVGAVVGATKAADGAALRARMPEQVFLVPGYGAQGGTLEDVRALVRPAAKRPADLGVLVTASRSVIYGFGRNDQDWMDGIRKAAMAMVAELRSLVPSGCG